jgi:dUTP pyrophosphatase
MQLKIVNHSSYPLPAYLPLHWEGLDLRANIPEVIQLKPIQRMLIPTGLFMELPDRYEAQIRPRSGLTVKHSISIVNTPGTIDPDYRVEIKTGPVNLSDTVFDPQHGQRIAQMINAKFEHIT